MRGPGDHPSPGLPHQGPLLWSGPVGPFASRLRLSDFAVLIYVLLVLGGDVARTQGWLLPELRSLLSALHLTTTPSGFDCYKFVTWFVLPLVFVSIGSSSLGVSLSASRREWAWLAVVFLGSCLAMVVVTLSSELSATYLRGARPNWAHRWDRAVHQLVWLCSWLPGYELLLRRLLLQRLLVRSEGAWIGGAVLPIAFIEFAYHLQKPWLEAVGVFFFSLALTFWAAKRPRSVMPALAHLCLELVLITFAAVYVV